MLQSLKDAGIETNEELTKFYTDYKADRPVVGMWAQDWTLPDPMWISFDQIISNAKISRIPQWLSSAVRRRRRGPAEDMTAVVDGSYSDGTTYKAATYDDTLNEGNDWDEGDTYLQLDNRKKT
jgi:beta-glucosidase